MEITNPNEATGEAQRKAAEVFYVPSEEERRMYYHGLPSRPELVSRSNGCRAPWVLRTEDQHPVEREILPVDPSTCLSNWEETLWPGFLEILDSGPAKEYWNCVDIVKMRTSDADATTVIWIGVEARPDGSQISCLDGYSVCCRGHQFVQSKIGPGNMENIVVEMRRTGITSNIPCASQTANLSRDLIRDQNTEPVPILDFDNKSVVGTRGTHHIGNSISVIDTPRRIATAGVYLTVQGTGDHTSNPTYLMISHQAAFPHDDAAIHPTGSSETGAADVIMPTTSDVTEMEESITYQLDDVQKRAERANPKLQERISRLQEDLDKLKILQDERSRRIGRVVFAPPRRPLLRDHEMPGRDHWLPDFALVNLEGGRLNSCKNLSNDVFVGDVRRLEAENINRVARANAERHKDVIQFVSDPAEAGFYQLKTEALVGKKEMESGTLLVAKRGWRSGVTFGHVNGIRSVVRVRCDRDKTPSDNQCFQLCIVAAINPHFANKAFSCQGDSGSLIWTLDGRIVGMLDGGAGSRRGDDGILNADTTYATPMAAILGLIHEKFDPRVQIL
ncbi:hypothetical protein F4861DRAFT_338098 [Xylaria intraflava]|nr:hypothetical protein F4861DRAFT_338098 [Xylaria intraflava]